MPVQQRHLALGPGPVLRGLGQRTRLQQIILQVDIAINRGQPGDLAGALVGDGLLLDLGEQPPQFVHLLHLTDCLLAGCRLIGV